MKRALKVIGIVAGVAVAAVGGFVAWSTLRPLVPSSYTTSTPTGGDIETTYLANGPHGVASKTVGVPESFKEYEVWYPDDARGSDETYPVVIVSNGTGVPASRAKAVWEHYASWGFIVLATEEEYSWNGFSSEMCARFAEKLNTQDKIGEWDENPLRGHLDLKHVAAVGHSQGGVGAINAATHTDHASMYTCAVLLSPTNEELAHNLEWDYDATQLTVPTLMMSSTGTGDTGLVVSPNQLADIYNHVASTTKVMAVRTDCDHGDMLYKADGHVTAFLRWQLCCDQEAAAAFSGESPEILSNPLYQDAQVAAGME